MGYNLGSNFLCLGSGEEMSGLIIISAYSKHIFWGIDIVAEVHIVYFIHISLVHVPLEN